MSIRYRQMLLIGLLLFSCYAYVLPRWSDWSQNSRLNLVLAIGDEGTVRIDRYVANTGDYAVYEGHAYSDKAPGLAFIALPSYLALRPLLDLPIVKGRMESIGHGAAMSATLRADGTGLQADKVRFALVQYLLTVLTVALPAALLGAMLYWALLRFGFRTAPAMLGVLAYGLGTAAAPYAGNFYSHQLVAVLLFGAFVSAWRGDASANERMRSIKRWLPAGGLLCGLLLGWSVISEYPVALAGVAIGLYALWHNGWRWFPALVLGGVLPLILLGAYDIAAFGTPLPVGYEHSALWQDQHQTGFLSITFPHPAALWGLTFGSFRGLFVRAPWLLLAVAGYIVWWRSKRWRAEWWVALVVPVSLYLFYSSSAMWWGGFTAGPRYLVPMLPFLAIPAALLINHTWSRPVLRVLSVLLVGLSVVTTWAEALAGQLFPTDAIRATWSGYVLPAWANGDIARNVGMAFGLHGPGSLLPLLIVIGLLAILLGGRGNRQTAPNPSVPLGNPGEVDSPWLR